MFKLYNIFYIFPIFYIFFDKKYYFFIKIIKNTNNKNINNHFILSNIFSMSSFEILRILKFCFVIK